MSIDEQKIDNAALALLFLTLHDELRAWKQFDWDILNRLYEKGLIYDPVGKAKSIVFLISVILQPTDRNQNSDLASV